MFSQCLEKFGEVGFVRKVLSGVVYVDGLPGVLLGEEVVFENEEMGQVVVISESEIEVMLLTTRAIKSGMKVARTGRKVGIEVGEALLGRVIDSLGRPLDHDQPITGKMERRVIDVEPAGIVGRKKISQRFLSGVMMVDLMIPMGKGQRELILGDRKTGKSVLLLQAILSQARQGSVCIYNAIAKKKPDILSIAEFLIAQGIMDKSVVVGASSYDSPGEIFLSPYTAMTIAEYFRDKGRDVLVVMDDLSIHAKFYRELALVSGKFPGRNSYPGDIFYVHSRLLERAGNFDVAGKDVAITCLPVAETIQGDMTGYISTNLMSMTDGHVFFDGDYYFRGRRPAINTFLSVTRVGRQTQTPLQRDASRLLVDLMTSYERTQGFQKFGAELGESSRQILAMGDRVLTFFDQPVWMVVPENMQLVLLSLLISGTWDGKGMEKIVDKYGKDSRVKTEADAVVAGSQNMAKLIELCRSKVSLFIQPGK